MHVRVPNTQESEAGSLNIFNVTDGETIYQRCLVIKGRSDFHEDFGDHVSVTVTSGFGVVSPVQSWPMSQGYFKTLVLLTPGKNTVLLQRHHNSAAQESAKMELTYIPLLQAPPLHLAIMIAKDSPLIMDCPGYKAGGISSAHSSLDAAIAKLRTTAYMWQALTAENLYMKGLGRRSFRIEEEYGLDSTVRASLNTIGQKDRTKSMSSVAKVHLVRSEKTVAELRDPHVAQQNPRARRRDDLHKYFEHALKAHGGVFDSSARPVVAGMIMDSHYSAEDDLLLGHAALGCHNPRGLSLGVFGSHLTYSWPRFFEEIPSCLTDTTPPGDLLCNDNGECETAWEACSIGQGAFLHEVGHAFGAPHTTGIMARGYAQDWPKNFLAQTAYCAKTKSDGATVIDGTTNNSASWDPSDALSFRCLPHFRLPGDTPFAESMRNALPSVRPHIQVGEPESLHIECKAGIARVTFLQNGEPQDDTPPALILDSTYTKAVFNVEKFDRSQALAVTVLGQNGRTRELANAWKLLSKRDFIQIPDSDIILHKRGVSGKAKYEGEGDDSDDDMADDDDESATHWAVLLHEKGHHGRLSRASAIDLRVGCIMDGAVVHFEDRHKTNCGPRNNGRGGQHSFGGHASQVLNIPKGVDIKHVQIKRQGWGGNVLGGIRVWLSDSSYGGELNTGSAATLDETEEDVALLSPDDGDKIVGFFGQSEKNSGFTTVFGIITAANDVELPPQTFDMEELRNTDPAFLEGL